jgi:hypothetical protein
MQRNPIIKVAKCLLINIKGSICASVKIAAFLDNIAKVVEYIEAKPINIRIAMHIHRV